MVGSKNNREDSEARKVMNKGEKGKFYKAGSFWVHLDFALGKMRSNWKILSTRVTGLLSFRRTILPEVWTPI